MHLVFVHGWGFDPRFWDALSLRLSHYKQSRFDFGFFSTPPTDFVRFISFDEPLLLIGHSLGFLLGIQQDMPWVGWVAINGFARFTTTPDRAGCVTPVVLRDMQRRLSADTATTLDKFYRMVGAEGPTGPADRKRLGAGLKLLRDGDITELPALKNLPGLILAARRDPLVPVAASATLGAPVWHEQGGHCLPQADPDWCAEHIEAFIKRRLAPASMVVGQFNRAAKTYDAAAVMQKQVAASLVAKAQPASIPQHILDLGCGTGFVAGLAAKRWPDAHMAGLDASPAMLTQAQRRVPKLDVIEGDASQSVLPRRYDLIFSSMMLHWLINPAKHLRRWAGFLNPKGRLHVALLGADSFKEWRELCGVADVQDGLWPMPTSASLTYAGHELEVENHIISYASANQFLQTLKRTGAASARQGAKKMAVGKLRAILKKAPQPFLVTYQIIYISASSGDRPAGSI